MQLKSYCQSTAFNLKNSIRTRFCRQILHTHWNVKSCHTHTFGGEETTFSILGEDIIVQNTWMNVCFMLLCMSLEWWHRKKKLFQFTFFLFKFFFSFLFLILSFWLKKHESDYRGISYRSKKKKWCKTFSIYSVNGTSFSIKKEETKKWIDMNKSYLFHCSLYF